ncbi:MAG TPA: hypothetical protein VGN80_14920 [Devosiaceae bacterium]|jgi:hypothetical protein|nr:hypothetical protein [Devosiaceae bacterium]
MNINKIALALLVLATGLAAANHAQAGQGTVMLGSSGFADRCIDNGGELFGIADGQACQLPTTLVECTFGGAYADCAWNGVQNKLEVVRLIGMVGAESLSSRAADNIKSSPDGSLPPCMLGGYPC